MSAGAIIAILDVLFVILIVLGFVAGYMRGVKRSLVSIGIGFGGVIIAGLITPSITNLILGINVNIGGVSSSLKTYFVSAISEDTTFASLIQSSPTMESLLTNIPSFLLCGVVFLALNLIFGLIGYAVYKIFDATCFKGKKKEKELGLKRNRWAGGAIGAFKVFAIALVAFMPLGSLVKLVDTNINQTAQAASTNASGLDGALGSLPPIVKDIVHGVNKSAFGVIGGCVGMDDFILDDMTKFSVNNEKIKLRKEIDTYLELYSQFSDLGGAETISQIDWDKYDALYQKAANAPLFKGVVLNVVGEMIDNYPNLINLAPELADFEQIFADIKIGMQGKGYVEFFKSDMDNLYYAFSKLGRSGYLDEVLINQKGISVTDAISLLTSEYADVLSEVVDRTVNLNILQSSFSATLDYALSKVSNSSLGTIFKDANTNISDWESLKTQVKTMVTKFGDVNSLTKAQGVNLTDIISDAKKLLLIKQNVPQILSKFGELLDTIDNLEFFKNNHGDKLLPQILLQLGVGNLLEVKGETINTYTELFEFVTKPVENLISLDLYAIIESGSDMKMILNQISKSLEIKTVDGQKVYSKILSDTILPIYKITAVHDKFFKPVIDSSAATGIIDLSLLEVAGDFDASYANWASELPHLTQIFSELCAIKFDASTSMLEYLLNGGDINEVVKLLGDEEVDAIIPPIMEAKSTAPLRDKLSEVVTTTMKNVTGNQSLSLDLSAATFKKGDPQDQTAEFANILKKFISVYKVNPSVSSLESIDKTSLGMLLEAIKQNAYRVELAGKTQQGVTRSIFDALILRAESEFNITFADVFKSQIYEIDFTKMFELIELANQPNEFASAFKNLVITGAHDQTTIGAVIDTVKANQVVAGEILEIAAGYEVDIVLTAEQQTFVDQKIESLESDGTIEPSIISNLRKLLGVNTN